MPVAAGLRADWEEKTLLPTVASSTVPAPIPTLAHAVALSEYISALLPLMNLLLASADISAPPAAQPLHLPLLLHKQLHTQVNDILLT